MVVAPRENHTVVMAPYVGARRTTRESGGRRDRQVDDKSTTDDHQRVADLLKGPKGTVVKITVSREGYAEQLVFTVTRDEIPRHSVDITFMLKPGVGYIRLSGLRNYGSRNCGCAETPECVFSGWPYSRHAREPGRPAE